MVAAAPETATAGRRARPRCMTPGPRSTRRPMIFLRSRCAPLISRRANSPPGRSPPTSLPVNFPRLRGRPRTLPPPGIARRTRTTTNSPPGRCPRRTSPPASSPRPTSLRRKCPPPALAPGRRRRRPTPAVTAPIHAAGRARGRTSRRGARASATTMTGPAWSGTSSPTSSTGRSCLLTSHWPPPLGAHGRPASPGLRPVRQGRQRPRTGMPGPRPGGPGRRPQPSRRLRAPGHTTWPTGSQPARSARRRRDGKRCPGARRRHRGGAGTGDGIAARAGTGDGIAA